LIPLRQIRLRIEKVGDLNVSRMSWRSCGPLRFRGRGEQGARTLATSPHEALSGARSRWADAMLGGDPDHPTTGAARCTRRAWRGGTRARPHPALGARLPVRGRTTMGVLAMPRQAGATGRNPTRHHGIIRSSSDQVRGRSWFDPRERLLAVGDRAQHRSPPLRGLFGERLRGCQDRRRHGICGRPLGH